MVLQAGPAESREKRKVWQMSWVRSILSWVCTAFVAAQVAAALGVPPMVALIVGVCIFALMAVTEWI